LFWEAAIKLELFELNIKPKQPPETAPIVFDLQPEGPKEVIETPDDAKVVEKQKKANFLSDKNALARSPETDPEKEVGEAFSRGDFESHDLPTTQGPPGAIPVVPEQKKSDPTDKPADSALEQSTREAIKEYIEKKQQTQTLPPGVRERQPGVRHDNRDSRAMDSGGLSFNTYNWNFAPYMLTLKEKIRRNIFPPPAFTRLGLISGSTLLRFKIFPDGKMKDLQILGHKGHKSLMQTSNTAIEISVPFEPLPGDFPEPFLEVTCRFSYLIHRAGGTRSP
jgi:outer membrane biosynthesis protein TonB